MEKTLNFCILLIKNEYDLEIIDQKTVYCKCQFTLYMMKKSSISQIFAENVTHYRKKQGYSQYDLSMKSGISRTMISHYEREEGLPPADRLQVLADSLSIPVYKLFEEREKDKNSETDLSDIDPRSVKKFRDILSLSPEDRNDIYRILNKMLRKNQLERQNYNARKKFLP